MPFNYATRFYEKLGKPTSETFIDILSKKENYQLLYPATLWLNAPLGGTNYLQDIFSEAVSAFMQHQGEDVRAYLDLKISLSDIAQSLINFIFEKPVIFDKNQLITCLEYGDEITDNTLFNVVKNKWQYRDNINILGFGAGTGLYEKRLVEFIKQHHRRSKITVYGFDPYADFKGSDLKLLDAKELQSNSGLKFDLIIARWVLHHVEPKDRWEMFVCCANASMKGSLLFLLEEGDFYKSKSCLKQRMYRFFLACVDIVVNAGLRPQWFLATTPQIGKNFFVDYLYRSDISDFENSFNFQFEKEIIPISDGNTFSQSLISYQVT